MNFATFDIETIPSTTLPEGVTPEFDPDTVKVGNIKDPVKAKGKIGQAKLDFDEALNKKMSLDPDLCEVVCFVGNKEGINYSQWTAKAELVKYAWDFIKDAYLDHIPLVSFNGTGFDLPVLWHQAMKLNIPVSPQVYYDLTKRYDNKYHYDIMELLSTWDFAKKKTKPLAFYLKLFGIGEKTGDGSEIYGWHKAGEYDKIREHCEQDVKLTAKLFEKLAPYIVKEE